MSRPWEASEDRDDSEYMQIYRSLSKAGPRDAMRLDLYRTKESNNEAVVIFEHIRKTAGSSFRNVLHTNLGPTHDFEMIVAREAPDWFDDFWTSTPNTDQIFLMAAHGASLAAPHCPRPVRLVTIVRNPVDRVISRYYFGKRKIYSIEQAVDDRATNKVAFYRNGQSRILLAPWMKNLDQIPVTADDKGAGRWLDGLHELLDRYLLGVQDRFLESMRFFADELGWSNPYEATVKVNRGREEVADLPEKTRARIEEVNWLDMELYRIASERLDAARR